MTAMTRRNLLRSFAAFPAAYGFAAFKGLFPFNGEYANPAAASAKKWNILLHGLHIVLFDPPDAPDKIRLIAPLVDYSSHKHSYLVGAGTAGAVPTRPVDHGKRKLDFPNGQPAYDPQSDATKIVLLNKSDISQDAPLFKPESSSDIAWWIDLPKPDSIVPLRARSRRRCPFKFCGSAGKNVHAIQLPFLVALLYKNIGQTPTYDLPVEATPDNRNLVFFSEPDCMQSQTNGLEALLQVNKLLGFSKLDGLDITLEKDCCVSNPGSGNHLDGVEAGDEECLQERKGCSPKCDSKNVDRAARDMFNVHVRSCMSLVVA